MLIILLIICLCVLSFFAGAISGIINYAKAVEKETESGVIKIGAKLYEVKPLSFAMRN